MTLLEKLKSLDFDYWNALLILYQIWKLSVKGGGQGDWMYKTWSNAIAQLLHTAPS